MLKKLTGYSILSLLSFIFFTVCFQTVANASTSRLIEAITPTPAPKILPTNAPTPTATPSPSPTATPTPTSLPTPTPTPTQIPSPTSVTDLETLFTKYSSLYSISKDLLEKIAQCESGKNPKATYLSYLGMFQFGPDTWSSIRTQMNLDPNPDLRTNAEEAIKTAAYKISIGGQSAWPNCN